ncbi:malate dehydrogenase, cytoplasmic-like isoform X2 [Periplaneta americana]|uniref:malate dehydrogenase, cytoplasmic-like isoform X2 n=1 Tax=Periplaneta americana TaxID=6978 RepID=UPI0037E71C43
MDNMWNLPNEKTYLPGKYLWKCLAKTEIRIAITAADKRMAPTLMYLIAKGDAFGKNQPVVLHLIDIPENLDMVRGFAMELMESGLPLLRDVIVTSKLEEAFKDIDVAFLLPYPKLTPQISRKDRLEERFALYKLHGEALNLYAKKTVLVLIVGYSANTRAHICSLYAPSIPYTNFAGLSLFAQNIATTLVSSRLRIKIEDIKDIIVWGNTTDLIYADLRHAVIKMPLEEKEISAYAAIKDDFWIKGEFNNTVRELSFDVTDAKRTVAMSVAAIDHMKNWWFGTPPNHLTSMVVRSDGSYNIPKELFFSFPVTIEDKKWKIVKGLDLQEFDLMKLDENIKELKKERNEAFGICKRFWTFPTRQRIEEETESDMQFAQFLDTES